MYHSFLIHSSADGHLGCLYAKQKKRHRCTEQTWTLWEKARVGCFERTASKHVYYLGWNRSPAQVGCMRQVLGPGALGRPRGMGWRGRWEGGSGRGTHVNPWLIHVSVWQKPLQYCKVISLQLIKIHEKKFAYLSLKWGHRVYLWKDKRQLKKLFIGNVLLDPMMKTEDTSF